MPAFPRALGLAAVLALLAGAAAGVALLRPGAEPAPVAATHVPGAFGAASGPQASGETSRAPMTSGAAAPPPDEDAAPAPGGDAPPPGGAGEAPEEPSETEPAASEPHADDLPADEPFADEPFADEPLEGEPLEGDPLASEPPEEEPAGDGSDLPEETDPSDPTVTDGGGESSTLPPLESDVPSTGLTAPPGLV